MLSNTEDFPLCLETEEPQNCALKNDENQGFVSRSGDDLAFNDNDKINGTFQNGRYSISDSKTIVVGSSRGVQNLADKTQIRNGETTKTSQKRRNVKRMHANLSGTKYAVGMDKNIQIFYVESILYSIYNIQYIQGGCRKLDLC